MIRIDHNDSRLDWIYHLSSIIYSQSATSLWWCSLVHRVSPTLPQLRLQQHWAVSNKLGQRATGNKAAISADDWRLTTAHQHVQ